MENKNIVDSIIPILECQAYRDREMILLDYYLKENFKRIYGTSTLADDECEIVRSNGTVYLKDIIFGDEETSSISIMYINGDIVCVSNTTGAILFTIKKVLNTIDNNIVDKTTGIKHRYHTQVLDGDDSFAYTETDANTNEVLFDARMIPVGSKLRDREVYQFIINTPELPEEPSLLKRIYDRVITGEGYVEVVTSLGLDDIFKYADRVFDKFQEEKEKTIAKSTAKKLTTKPQK